MTYWRCVYANKFTLIGYIALMLSVILFGSLPVGNLRLISFIAFEVGFLLSGCSVFGIFTVKAYRSVINSYQKYGYVDERLIDSVLLKSYCGRVGSKLALEDIRRRKLAE